MGHRVTTVVIESRSLVREGLVSLMASHSFQVLGGFASTANVDTSWPAAKAPDLVIFGSLRANEAASAADSIRKRWPEAKIILLFDSVSSADLQMLLGSEFDGYIPLFASPDTLICTLERIMVGNVRILVLDTGNPFMACASGQLEKAGEAVLGPNGLARIDAAQGGFVAHNASRRVVHGLSPREEEILKSVVRGHSNKMIARTCGVTDATIKVHMKSILRKIHVENRTQAAVWALERGFGAGSNSPIPPLEQELATG